MKHKSNMEKGQALIIIVFVMIGLIGITGLAVDGGMTFSDRRHAQNAADTSAMAGAMAKIYAEEQGWNDSTVAAYLNTSARTMAGENGYTGDLVNNIVYVYTCDMAESSCGTQYAGNPDYVQVIIESKINTLFARVLGIQQLNNRVQAVALADPGGKLYNGENIVALSPVCEIPGTAQIGGSTTVHLENEGGLGGIHVNTDSSCGLVCNSGSAVIDGEITTAGGDADLSEHCSDNNTGGTPNTGGDQWDFPVQLEDLGIDVPSECFTAYAPYKNYYGNYSGHGGAYLGNNVSVISPGAYNDFPPPKDLLEGKLADIIIMKPGIYCVNHVIKLTTTKLTLVGQDVTFFIRAGYDFSIEGGTILLDAPDDGDYAGYLMIVEPDYGNPLLSESPLDCKITGGPDNNYEGAIFAPYCDCNIAGTSDNDNINSQLICYTVKLTGTSTINMFYDSSKNPEIKTTIGLIK